MQNDCPIPVKDLALMVSTSYIEYLFRKNGDNIYLHPLAKVEIERIAFAHFLESYYISCEFSELDRQVIYASYLDTKNLKHKCELSIGLTICLNQDGITSLNDLMDNYILMMTSNTSTQINTYH